ncbi:MAG: glycosyltransferase family 4 protein, partial [Paraprevotella sp.]|nr:glycosyltransferase family 4 protein [Paraprevotella sp.]
NKAVFSMIDSMRKEYEVSLGLSIRHHGVRGGVNLQQVDWVNRLRELWPDVTFHLYHGQAEYPEEPYRENIYCKILSFLNRSFARKYKRAYKRWSRRSPEGDPARAQSQLPIYLPQYNPGFQRFVHDISRRGFDIIQVEMYEFLFLGYILPSDVKRIFVHHELRFVRHANEIKLFRTPCDNDILAYEEAKSMEIGALHAYDRIITLTETDKQILSDYLPAQRISVSPVSTVHPEQSVAFRPCRDFVFIGSGNHFPNQDAMHWFSNEILPLLQEKGCTGNIYVVGNWQKTDRESVLHKHPEIRFTGYIENLTAFLNGKISIIPLRIGSGMRIKILEAIKAHSPFITTSKGVEGLPFRNGETCLIADESTSFAKAMMALQQSPARQEALSDKAETIFKSLYDPGHLYQIRKQIYTETDI